MVGLLLVMLILTPVSFVMCLAVNGLIGLLVAGDKRRVAAGFMVTPGIVALLWGLIFIGKLPVGIQLRDVLAVLVIIAGTIPASFGSLLLLERFRG